MKTIPVLTLVNYNDIPNEQKLVNMEAMPRGLNCKYLECTLSHHNPPQFIAYQWRRKEPDSLPSGHVLVVFNGGK